MMTKSKPSFLTMLALPAAIAGLPSIATAETAWKGIEEIVVTAQRRSESTQDASISIDVLDANMLEKAGLTNAFDLPSIAPGIQVSAGGNSLQIYIRGAGDFTTTAYSNAAVIPVFDGISSARTQYAAGTFYDLERIEVLKGPQGTLYGRNAVGGVLNILPRKPEFDATSGYVKASLQNYSGKTLEGALNLPLTDTSALRASFQVVDRDGYIDDGTNDDEHQSVRLQYLNQVNEDLSVRLVGHYSDFGGRGQGKVVWNKYGSSAGPIAFDPITPNDPWTSIQDSLTEQNDALNAFYAMVGAPVVVADFDTQNVKQDMQAWGVHAEINYDIEDVGTLTVIPAYQYNENNSTSIPGLGYSTFNLGTGDPSTSDGTSLEVRLANQTDKLDWVVGAFYFNEDQTSNNYLDIANVANFDYSAELNTRSYAAFADTVYSFTDAVRGIFGIRYTDESKDVDAHQYHVVGKSIACPLPGDSSYPGNNCLVADRKGEYQDEKVTYRLGFEYDIADESMLFATVATGFKSGGQVNANVPPYKPEDLTAWTIGSKNRFLNNTLQFNAELFYWEYKDHQENVATLDRDGTRASVLLNTGKATSQGVSLDTVWMPSESDTVRFAIEYTDSEYDGFTYYEYGRTPSNECFVTEDLPAGSPATAQSFIDCTGKEMARTPKLSGSLSYSKVFQLNSGGVIEVSPSMTFASARWLSAEFNKNQRAESYEQYNLSATYTAASDQYSVQLFGRNLTDEAVYTGSRTASFVTDYATQDIAAPRTYGVSLTVNF